MKKIEEKTTMLFCYCRRKFIVKDIWKLPSQTASSLWRRWMWWFVGILVIRWLKIDLLSISSTKIKKKPKQIFKKGWWSIQYILFLAWVVAHCWLRMIKVMLWVCIRDEWMVWRIELEDVSWTNNPRSGSNSGSCRHAVSYISIPGGNITNILRWSKRSWRRINMVGISCWAQFPSPKTQTHR